MKPPAPRAGIAALLTCVLVWELLPAGFTTAGPGPVPARAARATGTGLPAAFNATMLDRPLFSPDRRLAPAATGSAAAVEEPPRLTGIIVGPTGAWAIFADQSGHPNIVATGGKIGRFEVGMVAPGQVFVTAAEGERVLRPSFAKSPRTVGVPIPTPAGTTHPKSNGPGL